MAGPKVPEPRRPPRPSISLAVAVLGRAHTCDPIGKTADIIFLALALVIYLSLSLRSDLFRNNYTHKNRYLASCQSNVGIHSRRLPFLVHATFCPSGIFFPMDDSSVTSHAGAFTWPVR